MNYDIINVDVKERSNIMHGENITYVFSKLSKYKNTAYFKDLIQLTYVHFYKTYNPERGSNLTYLNYSVLNAIQQIPRLRYAITVPCRITTPIDIVNVDELHHHTQQTKNVSESNEYIKAFKKHIASFIEISWNVEHKRKVKPLIYKIIYSYLFDEKDSNNGVRRRNDSIYSDIARKYNTSRQLVTLHIEKFKRLYTAKYKTLPAL